jgi:Alginate export
LVQPENDDRVLTGDFVCRIVVAGRSVDELLSFYFIGDQTAVESAGVQSFLIPNGYYVTLAGYTGYVNFIHLKPSVTLHPIQGLQIMMAVGMQWRQTTTDAVYLQPNIPLAGTAGRRGRYTGTYGQFRGDWVVTRHISLALEAVHFTVTDTIREAGGHNGNYVGAEFKYGW